ncbi:MAG: thrombospondin type-1 domain-containing protein [Candidatus Pacearchaeota archaeon]
MSKIHTNIKKNLWIAIAIIISLIFLMNIVSSLQGVSTSYTLDSKEDSFAVTNATSTTLTQRLVGGLKAVSQYVSATFTGRFGILGEDLILDINLTYPINNSEIIRGNDAVSGEDDKGLIPDAINLTAKVYQSGTTTGFSGAMCYFYNNRILIGNSSTNSSGDCIMNYTKSSLSISNKEIFVNYSISTADTININYSLVNFSLITYTIGRTMTNLRTIGKYYDGDVSILEITLLKANLSGTFYYDPQNMSANATTSAGAVYPESPRYYTGSIIKTALGHFSANATTNYTLGALIKWVVLASDNNYTTYLATTVHGDEDICKGDFGSWSDWSTCSGGSQTRSRTDSSSCTEVETQTCGESGGGDDGDDCTPVWGEWGNWGTCIDGREIRTRSDGCGSSETEFRECTCIANWQCTGWGDCFFNESYIPAGLLSPAGGWVQTRSCIDLNSCGYLTEKPLEVQECILGLVINYTPENLFIVVANNTNLDFSVDIKNGGLNILETKWYLDSIFQKGDSQVGSLSSSYSKLLSKNSYVEAKITAGVQNQDVAWQIIVNNTARLDCKEDWVCEYYTCGEDGYQDVRYCVDLNKCGTRINQPPIRRKCLCIPEYECMEWEGCHIDYNLTSIVHGRVVKTGIKERVCKDSTGCEGIKIEYENCSLSVPVDIRRAVWCFESYVEIYEIPTNKLVSRIKEYSEMNVKKLNIGFIASEFEGYCDYCYDGIKNYDEEAVDCGGSGCPLCAERGEFFDWFIYVKITLWVIVLLLTVTLILTTRKEARERNSLWKSLMKVKSSILIVLRRLRKIRTQKVSIPRARKLRLKLPRIEIKIRIKNAIARRKRIRRERKIKKKEIRIARQKVRAERVPPILADLKAKLKKWKGHYATASLKYNLDTLLEEKISKWKRNREERKMAKSMKRARKNKFKKAKKEAKIMKKAKRRIIRREKKTAKKEAKIIKKKIRRGELSRAELADLKKKLAEWNKKGYYNTTNLHKKIDKFENNNFFRNGKV